MQTYQIHIVKNSRETETENSKQASDYAAIRHARNAAEDCEHVEVWRGSHCVFAGRPAERGS
jgi:hypothetical protein